MSSHERLGSGRNAAWDPEAFGERIEALERRLAERGRVDQSEIEAGIARAVQSIGVVVDYLATRGLIDRDELRTHVERKFSMTDHDGVDDRGVASIDIYGWLVWAKASRFLREDAIHP